MNNPAKYYRRHHLRGVSFLEGGGGIMCGEGGLAPVNVMRHNEHLLMPMGMRLELSMNTHAH